MVNPNRFYTYAYLREDKTPYYIGKGSQYRYRYRGKKDIKPPKDKSRIIFLKQNLTEEEAYRHEKYMIAVFGRKDLGTGMLRNRSDGGEGGSGVVFDEKRKEKLGERMKGKNNPFYGRNHSQESIDKMKEKLKGRTPWNKNKRLPDECVSYSAIYNRDYRQGIKRIDRNRKFVNPLGVTITTTNLKQYCRENSLDYTSMLNLCKGKITKHKGYTLPNT
jgi:hypothetical protein